MGLLHRTGSPAAPRLGSQEQKERWLHPLLAGQLRSAFSMTEPETAPTDGVPSQHVPTRREAAQRKFADLLEAVTQND